MGAGGAVYVQGGRLGIGWSTFEDNAVRGGNGSFNDSHAGGGGGGLSGTGGNANYAGGGGGGARGDGGDGGSQTGGGGGGTSTSGQTPEPGDRCGGRGGEYNELTGGADDGDNAEYPPFFCPGGGGGGGTERVPIFDPFSGGSGGDGSYGGGGGGAGEEADGGHGGFGGGGGGSGPGDNGGDGGFGGGGGNGQALDIGGGISVGGRGQGGTFAGDGAVNGGGGGAALGGAVFGYAATIDIVNSTFSGNSARRGLSGDPSGDDPASDGRAAGGAIFAVAGSLHVDGSTVAGNSTGEFDLDGNGDPTGLGGGGIVVYKPTTGESASLRLRNTIVANNGPFECYTRNGVSVTGSSTNLITDSRDNTHGDPHCAGVVESADPQLGALAITAPGRTPTLAIGAGSSAIDRADPATAPVDDQRGVIRGAAPDIGAFEFRGAPPQTTITLTPATPDGSNGWYRGPVTVNVSATDADSTVAQTRCDLDPAPEPAAFADLPDASCGLGAVSTDGTHAVYAASIDTEGNVEAPLVTATFKIDATKPVLDPTLSSTTVTLGQTGVTALPHATDATSGIASASCDPVDTTTPGVHSVQCSAADRAGNSTSASVTYVVEYRILGFFEPAPGSKWLAGQTVPIKVALAGANETRIPDAAAAALASSCRVTFTASGAQTKSAQCLRYDSATDQFVYNWKLGKPLGAVTISVSVSYPGTATATRLSESIAVTRK